MRRPECILTVLLVVSGLAGVAGGVEDGAPLEARALKASGIELDIHKHEIRVDATVCLERGILEYLACAPNTFEHEALFSMKCKPSVLHLCLLAIGLEPYAFDTELDWWATAREQPRSRVSIEVECEQEGKKQRRRISEFLVSRGQKEAVVPNVWIFTGSYFGQRAGTRLYAADVMGGVIGLGLEGASVLQFGEMTGNPYRGDEQGLEINAAAALTKGSKVQLIITPLEEKGQQTADVVKEGER